MSQAWSAGSTRAWRTIRARVLLRDQGLCRLGLDGCTTLATCVHHTKGRAVTGDDEAHLVASCASCNGKIGDPTTHNPPARSVTKW